MRTVNEVSKLTGVSIRTLQLNWDKYKGKVSGSNGEIYDVEIDKSHPKRSTCNCAFAKGRREAA